MKSTYVRIGLAMVWLPAKVDDGINTAKRPGGYQNGDVDEQGYLRKLHERQ